jgi:hypothetical protein
MGSKTGLSFACRLDGGAWAACADSVSYANLAEGEHTVEVRATDRWGQIEALPATLRWTIDLTPPRTFLLVSQATGLRPATAVVGSETGASFQCRSAAGAWAVCPATFPLPDLGHSYGLYVRAVDAAGNVDPGEASAVIEPKPAGISFTGAPAVFTASVTRGRSSWSCSVDGADPAACPEPLTFSSLPYGTHTLRVSDASVPGLVWPTLTWTDALPVPVLAGGRFPALVALGARARQASVAKKRLPRLLVQSNAPAGAGLVLRRSGRPVHRWKAPIARGGNVIRLARAAWRQLRPGRYVLTVSPTNAAGSGTPLALRFDVVRAMRR